MKNYLSVLQWYMGSVNEFRYIWACISKFFGSVVDLGVEVGVSKGMNESSA